MGAIFLTTGNTITTDGKQVRLWKLNEHRRTSITPIPPHRKQCCTPAGRSVGRSVGLLTVYYYPVIHFNALMDTDGSMSLLRAVKLLRCDVLCASLGGPQVPKKRKMMTCSEQRPIIERQNRTVATIFVEQVGKGLGVFAQERSVLEAVMPS